MRNIHIEVIFSTILLLIIMSVGCDQANNHVKIEREKSWDLPSAARPTGRLIDIRQEFQDKIKERLRPEYDPKNGKVAIMLKEIDGEYESVVIMFVAYNDLSQKDQSLIKGKLRPDAEIDRTAQITVGDKANTVEVYAAFNDLTLEEQSKFTKKYEPQKTVVISVWADW